MIFSLWRRQQPHQSRLFEKKNIFFIMSEIWKKCFYDHIKLFFPSYSMEMEAVHKTKCCILKNVLAQPMPSKTGVEISWSDQTSI